MMLKEYRLSGSWIREDIDYIKIERNTVEESLSKYNNDVIPMTIVYKDGRLFKTGVGVHLVLSGFK